MLAAWARAIKNFWKPTRSHGVTTGLWGWDISQNYKPWIFFWVYSVDAILRAPSSSLQGAAGVYDILEDFWAADGPAVQQSFKLGRIASIQ